MYTSSQRNAVPLLPRYKCRLCEKFKGPENFSNKELNDYRHKKLVNKSTNEISAKLRCRQCSGAQVQELQCEGHCGNWLPLSEFSKSSRTNGTYWCKRCTNWKEGQEPGIVTAPAPNAEVVPDKDGTYNGNGSLSEPEDDASDDDWDVATNAATSPAAREGSFMDVPRIQVPYSDMVPSSAIASLSIAAAQSASGGASNMTQNINDEVKTQSSASNPYENSKSDATVTQSGWNAVDARRRAPVGPPIAFNAWSPNGEQQLRYRYPSGSEQNSSGSGVASSRTSSIAPVVAALPRNNGNWAKPAGRRNAGVSPLAAAPPVSAPVQAYDYGDESEDEP